MIVTKSQRLLGIGLLVLVNVVWVLSAELTRYLFIDLDFARPFFFTYAKSCMLSLLLVRYSCSCPPTTTTKGTTTTATGEGAEGATGDVHELHHRRNRRKSKNRKKSTTIKTTKSGSAIYTQLENIIMGSDGEEEEVEQGAASNDDDECLTAADEQKYRRQSHRMCNNISSSNDMNNNISMSTCSSSSSIIGKTGGDDGGETMDSERSYEAQKLTSVKFEHFKLPSSATTDDSELCSDDEALLLDDPSGLDNMKRKLFDALVDKRARQQQRRRVRFSSIRQVRALPEKIALDARLARLPYYHHRHIVERFQHCPNCPALRWDSALISYAVIFAPLWMITSLAFQSSLALSSVTNVNLFSASSPLFVLILGAFFGKNSVDAFTGTKLALVLLNLAGVCVVSRVSGSMLGATIAMFASVSNAVYLFTLSRFSAKSHRPIDAVLLLGIVGIFSLVVCTPLMFTLHNMGIERQVPLPSTRQFVVLTLNAFIGTLFADSIWLYATLLTGGLTSALSGSLGIPLSMLADAYLRNQPPNAWQVLSSIPIMVSFVGASLIAMPQSHPTGQHEHHQKEKCSPPVSASVSSEDGVGTAAVLSPSSSSTAPSPATASPPPPPLTTIDIVGGIVDQQQQPQHHHHLRLITASPAPSALSATASPASVAPFVNSPSAAITTTSSIPL